MEILRLEKEKSFWCRSTSTRYRDQILFRPIGARYGELTLAEQARIATLLQPHCSATTWTLISCTCCMPLSCGECLYCSTFQKCGRLRRMCRWLGRMMVMKRTRAPGRG